MKVTLKKLEKAGKKQTLITLEACKLLEEAVNHLEFKKEVLKAEYTATWQNNPNTNNVQSTHKQILETILQGRESNSKVDFEIDLHIKLKKKRRGVLGSTILGKFPITTAYWFINKCIEKDDVARLAAHFMHEWLHVAGFYHFGGNSARGDVPYVIGDIVYDIILDHVLKEPIDSEIQ